MDLLVFEFVVIVTFSQTLRTSAADVPRTQAIANSLAKFFDEKTSYTLIRKRIKELHLEYDAEPSHCPEIKRTIKRSKAQIESLFTSRVRALKRIVDGAEQLSATAHNVKLDSEYCYSGASAPSICMESDSARLDADYSYRDVVMRDDGGFQRAVSFRESGIQIPDHVLQKDVRLHRHLDITQALDKVFLKNRADFPGISWQYFGSESGMLRVYPAFSWPASENDKPSTLCNAKHFDARHRPWYGRALLPPKNILVLLDVSGSMYGQSLRLIKSLSRALVDSLDDDDYVGIAEFNKNVTFIPCTSGFTLATVPAKTALKEAINAVTAAKDGTYEGAMTFAFNALDELDRFIRSSSQPYRKEESRVKVIVILSDGSTEFPKAVLDKRDPNATVKIISYQVGLDINPKGGLMKMACLHNGLFVTLSLKAEVPRRVLRFRHPLYAALNWTKTYPFYISNIYYDCLDTGPALSLSMAVHNFDKVSNEKFMGVAGVDIRLEEIAAVLSNTSSIVRTILVNKSGYVIYHSELDRLNSSLWSNFSLVIDWTTLEPRTPDLKKLKEQVYHWESGHIRTVFWERSADPRRLRPVPVTYVFEPVMQNMLMLIFVHSGKEEHPCSSKSLRPAKETCEKFCMNLNNIIGSLDSELDRPWIMCCDDTSLIQTFPNNSEKDILYTALHRPDEIQFQHLPKDMRDPAVDYDMIIFRLLMRHPYPAVIGAFGDGSTFTSQLSAMNDKHPTIILDDSGIIYANNRNDSNSTDDFPHISDSAAYLWDHFIEKGILESETFFVPIPNCSVPSGASRPVPLFRMSIDILSSCLRASWNALGQISAFLFFLILWILPVTVFAVKAHADRKLSGSVCTRKDVLTYWRKAAVSSHGAVKCPDSVREFGLTRIPGTNLLLLSVPQHGRVSDSCRKEPKKLESRDKCPCDTKTHWNPISSVFFATHSYDYMSTDDCAYAKITIPNSAEKCCFHKKIVHVIFSLVIFASAFTVLM